VSLRRSVFAKMRLNDMACLQNFVPYIIIEELRTNALIILSSFVHIFSLPSTTESAKSDMYEIAMGERALLDRQSP
jgi:hypothetical protein